MSDFMTGSFDEIIERTNNTLRIDKNFDIVHRIVNIGIKQGCLYCANPLVDADLMEDLQEFFYRIDPLKMPQDAEELSKRAVPYSQVELSNDEEQIINQILSGMLCIVVEGYDNVLLLDCRKYPSRGVQEPEKYKVLRGSRDGFVETMICNVGLIRRRVRSTALSFEPYVVGKSSKTDVCICYMEDRVDKEMLADIQNRIKNIEVDALTMNQESLAECIYHRSWYNPFPKFKYTERPDTASACLLEGQIILMVDNSPAVMVVPTTIFDIMEEADDYYFPPVTGTYLRFARTLLSIISMFLTPVYMLLLENPGWVPVWLQFIIVKDVVYVPIIIQLLILEVGVDGLKLAAVNTPSMLSTPLSLIAAIVIGESAVNSGWINAEVMLYMAVVTISSFTQDSYELGYALKFMRIITLLLTWLFGLWGLIAGTALLFLAIATNKTITGKSYLAPLIPFNKDQLFRRFFRVSLRKIKK